MTQTVKVPETASLREPERTGGTHAPRVASIEDIRAKFPALEREHAGLPVAYFDGPGGTQVPRDVADAVTDYLCHHNANTHWNYPTSAETDAMIGRAREAIAELVGGAPEEIVFGANATTLAFHVSRALAKQISAGDEVVVTELDHHANVGPWQELARESGCTLRAVKMDCETGTLNWTDFERVISKKTKLVAVGAASNALGTTNDVRRAAKLAKTAGALTFVDAVHYVPHNLADVCAMDCDFLVCSAYKFYGPHVGALWCRRELLQTLPFSKVQPSSNLAPERAETGTLNHEGIAGAAATVEFLASLGDGQPLNSPAISAGTGTVATDRSRMSRLSDISRRGRLQAAFAGLHERSATLTAQIWRGLAEIDGVTLYGPPPDGPRTSTVAFTMRGVASSEVARRLADRALFVSHGNFYAATVIERLGLGRDGLVRAGCACYTTAEEVARLIDCVREIAETKP
jgi:cysteine desulfurase family protein (TIGR01976 family)